MEISEFPKEMHGELGFYVYRLIDPRNGETFYVGKGKGNRVFQHVAASLEFDEAVSENDWKEDRFSTKIQTILDVKAANLEVVHIIHRHGMTEKEALQVEAALIDVYPGLTNEMRGHDAARGPAYVNQLRDAYAAEEMVINDDDKLLLIKTTHNVLAGRGSIYDAVRWAWPVSPGNARRADFVLAVIDGLCVGAFVADEWLVATPENFPHFQVEANRRGFSSDRPERHGFNGSEAPAEIQERFVGKRVPKGYARQQNTLGYLPRGWQNRK